ncbi:MAG: CopD family protein [Hyphomonadaceae bacterium]|nr:CopD family protein [Hyphomonadaceae bacterium]
MEADPLAPWLLAVKLGLYASALLAAGLGLHASMNIVERAERTRCLRLAALLGGAALVFAISRLLIANVQLGGSLGSIFDPATLAWTWPTLAPSSVAFAIGAGLLFVAWLFQRGAFAGLASVALASGFALTGHTQALEPPGLAPWAAGLHVLIAAFWIAAPVTLWPGASLSDANVLARTERFSRLALFSIPVLFALGLWLAVLLAGSISALLTSSYGQLLTAKLVVAGAALGLGAYNKQVVTRKLRETPTSGRRALTTTLSFDALLFAGALILVGAATTLTGPPTD